ncbi:conserved hypothetical protein [Brugia malayi]|uniref:Protein kinase domain-containing protein n=1 Tax=Brugia malayi TaxID=6279 RepID=A0A4E9G3I3_BRUMA|nr:uncharacterized protein BM_BM8776 [Brugia malayi]VIP00113.1 conserved hypothetical protein [Brugia malayi]
MIGRIIAIPYDNASIRYAFTLLCRTIFYIFKVPKAILKRAIIRSPWELRHETVIIENKIGEGEFGEVFSGKYKLPWRMR